MRLNNVKTETMSGRQRASMETILIVSYLEYLWVVTLLYSAGHPNSTTFVAALTVNLGHF